MKKHGVKKFLLTMFRSHIGHEHSELVDGKEGTEKMVEKILKLIKDKDKEGDPAVFSELLSLIEGFHENYNVLYGKYDALIEKLKVHSHHKKEMNGDLSAIGTSSDSEFSSSDSDRSSMPGKKYRKQIEVTDEDISVEDLSALKEEVAILNKKNLELQMEVEHIRIEDQTEQSNVVVQRLEEELERVKEDFKRLEVLNGSLKSDIEAIVQQHSDVSQELVKTLEEKEALLSEKLCTESFLEVLKFEKGLFEGRCTQLENEKHSLNVEVNKLSKQVADMDREVIALNELNFRLSSELSTTLIRFNDAEKENRDLKSEADVSLSLANEKSVMNLKLIEDNKILKQKMASVEQQKIDLEEELSTLKDDKITLEYELSTVNSQLLEFQATCEKMRLGSESLNDNEHKLLGGNAILNEELRKRCEELNATSLVHAEVVEKLKIAEEQIRILNLDLQSLSESKSQLLSDHEILKKELGTIIPKTSELQMILDKIEEEKLAMKDENTALSNKMCSVLDKLNDAENLILGLTDERDTLHDSNLKVQEEILNLKLENVARAEQVDALNAKIITMNEETSMVSNRLSDADKLVTELNNEIGDLQNEIMTLNAELESEVKKVVDLGNQLASANDEKKELALENMKVLDKIERYEQSIEDLNIHVQVYLESAKEKAFENANLLDEIEKLKHELVTESKEKIKLCEDLNARNEQISSLNNMISEAELEIEEARKTIEGQMTDLQLLRETKLKLVSTVENLKQNLSEKDADNDALSWKYIVTVDHCENTERRIQMLLDDLEKQRDETSQLLVDYEGMKEDFIASDVKVSELELLLASMSEEKNEMDAKIETYVNDIQELGKLTYDLKNETNHLTHENYELHASVDELSRKLIDIQAEKDMLVMENIAEVKQMQHIQADLGKRLEEKGDEVSTLENELSGIELALIEQKEKFEKMLVNHSLLKDQFLESCRNLDFAKATIEELKANEEENKEIFNKSIKGLQEERGKLQEQILIEQHKALHSEAAFTQTKEALEKQLERVSDLELVLQETCGKVNSKFVQCSNEILIVKKELAELINEKEVLENGKNEHLRRVSYLESTVTVMQEEILNLKSELAIKIQESEQLTKMIEDYKEIIPQLQQRVVELEEEAIFKDEEKREAIRQLCILIEYHRENYEHLYHRLSPKRNGDSVEVNQSA